MWDASTAFVNNLCIVLYVRYQVLRFCGLYKLKDFMFISEVE